MTATSTSVVPVTITAGRYIELRREAAGLSIEDVARICTSSPVGLPASIAAIADAENDRAELELADLLRMRSAFPFVPSIYLALAQGIEAGEICRSCGCSWDDACEDQLVGMGCGWADRERTICTACVRRPAGAPIIVDAGLTRAEVIEAARARIVANRELMDRQEAIVWRIFYLCSAIVGLGFIAFITWAARH